jgi:uncharacterized repeat protein (TIGR02543 family)
MIALLFLFGFNQFTNGLRPKATAEYHVGTFLALQTALADADSNIHITLSQDITLTAPLIVESGKTVSIDGQSYSLIRDAAFTGDLLTVSPAATLDLSRITINGNKANQPDANGSLIHTSGVVNLNSDAVLSDNASDSVNGGAVHVTGGGMLSINGGQIARNTSSAAGGGVYVDVGGTLNMNQGAIFDNSAYKGGGIWFEQSADAAVIANALIYGNSASFNGGGIGNDGADMTISDTRIYENQATAGAGIYTFHSATVTLSGSNEISDNTATDSGGGIYNGRDTAMHVDGALITNNSAATTGGGINSLGDLEIQHTSIIHNTGGGIFATANLTFEEGTISDNTATYGGGGIYFLTNGTYSPYTLIVKQAEILNNYSAEGGGISAVGGFVTISDSLISNNRTKAGGIGGGIFFDTKEGGTLVITDTTISFNHAASGGGIGVLDPALSTVHIGSGVIFSNNSIEERAYEILPEDLADYEAAIDANTVWTKPFTQGYNNVDIRYRRGEEVVVVRFDSNGGSEVDPQKLYPSELAVKPDDPTRPGYKFVGWYVNQGLADQYDFDTPVIEDITLYAKWQAKSPVGSDQAGSFGNNPVLTGVENSWNLPLLLMMLCIGMLYAKRKRD